MCSALNLNMYLRLWFAGEHLAFKIKLVFYCGGVSCFGEGPSKRKDSAVFSIVDNYVECEEGRKIIIFFSSKGAFFPWGPLFQQLHNQELQEAWASSHLGKLQ